MKVKDGEEEEMRLNGQGNAFEAVSFELSPE